MTDAMDEIQAIGAAYQALKDLDQEALARALQYLEERITEESRKRAADEDRQDL